MPDYPQEPTWWANYERDVAATYAEAHQPFPNSSAAFRWFSRAAYDIGAGMDPDTAKRKHLRELREALGLPFEHPTTTRLRVAGRDFVNDAGRWNWRGVSAFSLAYAIWTGDEAKVVQFLDWCAANDVTIVRVFTTAVNMFDLPPIPGRESSVRVLELAAQRGIYVELVGLADTRVRSFDQTDHMWQLGQIATQHPNVLIEIANEPNHETQASQVKDVNYLLTLRSLVPANVLVSLGAAHGTDDENPIYWRGDYATVHGDRKGGWESVRHTREMQAIRDNGHWMPVVNDEPDRNLLPDQHLGMALLCHEYRIGDTVHLAGLRYAQIPAGDELLAFNARKRGWAAIPSDWSGEYCNNATVSCGGAISHFDDTQIVRLYGSFNGGSGYIIGLGVQSESSIQWTRAHTKLIDDGQARLWWIP